MAGRKKIKDIAHGLLGTFVSRNNDINGYWGIGVLNKFAVQHNLTKVIIDLLGRDLSWAVDSPIQIAKKTYQRRLLDTLARVGIHRDHLERAEIHLRFATFDEFPDAVRDTRGDPYTCCVILTNKNGIKYSASKVGVCAPHDRTKDHRSNRVT